MKKLLSSFCLFLLAILPACLSATPPTQFPYPADMNDPSIAHLKKHTFLSMKAFKGWCTQEKASVMMDLILATKPKVCVEIGVCGGSSAYPTLMALLFNQIRGHHGILYGIDPWKSEEAAKHFDPSNVHALWWTRDINLDQFYSEFIQNLKAYKLDSLCVVLRKTSEAAVNEIPDIDILHIDGNHSEPASVLDVTLYLPKVKEGGYIWFDDINYDTTKKAFSLLLEKCEIIYQKENFVLVRKKAELKALIKNDLETKIVIPTETIKPSADVTSSKIVIPTETVKPSADVTSSEIVIPTETVKSSNDVTSSQDKENEDDVNSGY